MKSGLFGVPAVQRICLLMPGILFSAVVLAVMFVNMQAELSAMQAESVVSLYPVEQSASQNISFPYEIQGTTLIAERIAVYDGPYIEDGSNEEVTEVMALVLHNRGNRTVACAQITLLQNTRRLLFLADTIPPGATVLVLEANRSRYEVAEYQGCYGTVTTGNYRIVPPSDIKIEISGMNLATVTNMTDTVLTNICLHHKGWLQEPGIYVGGATQVTLLETLLPGAPVSVRLENFADGYSKIIQISQG